MSFRTYIKDSPNTAVSWDTDYSTLILRYAFDTKRFPTTSNRTYMGQSSLAIGEIEKKLTELGGVKFTDHLYSSCYGEWWMWDDAVIKIVYDGGRSNTKVNLIQFYSCNSDLTQKLTEIGETFSCVVPNGSVYALIPSSHGLINKNLGLGSIPIKRDNYRSEVVEGYDRIVKDLKSGSPLGRLAILDGCPGTGKTYLIRALLGDLPEVKFLILPSNMTANLGGPEILAALIDASDKSRYPGDDKPIEKATHPLVLIIEDADSCLTTRGSDNISAISTILNLSDGIIGNLLDLRIICTTNVDSKDIDEALLRNGRLSARVEVGLLDKEQAYQIYLREGGAAPVVFDKKFYSLADVYAMANGGITESNTKQTKVVGFQS